MDIAAELEGLIIATSKISILGEMSTVEKSRKLLTTINEALFKTLALSMPLRARRDSLKFMEEQLALNQVKIVGFEQEMRELFEKRDMGEKSYKCKNNLEFHRMEAVRLSEVVNREQLNAANEYENFTKHILEMTKSINRKVNELIILVRSELNLITSEDQLTVSSEAMQAAAEMAINQLFLDMKSFVATPTGTSQ